jgi:hypothetical protein
MPPIHPFDLFLPHIYTSLINQKDIRGLLSLAATCKDFNRRYKGSTISKYVDTIRQIYQTIQTMWTKEDTGFYISNPGVIIAFKNEEIHIYSSVLYIEDYKDIPTQSSIHQGRRRSLVSLDGKVGITFNISIQNNRKLKSQDLLELKNMLLVSTLQKKEIYSKKSRSLYEIQYLIDFVFREWSIDCKGTYSCIEAL